MVGPSGSCIKENGPIITTIPHLSSIIVILLRVTKRFIEIPNYWVNERDPRNFSGARFFSKENRVLISVLDRIPEADRDDKQDAARRSGTMYLVVGCP